MSDVIYVTVYPKVGSAFIKIPLQNKVALRIQPEENPITIAEEFSKEISKENGHAVVRYDIHIRYFNAWWLYDGK